MGSSSNKGFGLALIGWLQWSSELLWGTAHKYIKQSSQFSWTFVWSFIWHLGSGGCSIKLLVKRRSLKPLLSQWQTGNVGVSFVFHSICTSMCLLPTNLPISDSENVTQVGQTHIHWSSVSGGLGQDHTYCTGLPGWWQDSKAWAYCKVEMEGVSDFIVLGPTFDS